MARKLLCLVLAWGLLGAAGPLPAQAPPRDEELSKGIRQADEGDYDAAIVTLDAVSRRMAAEKAAPKELAQAYLYLGIAYLGRSHELSARARFVDALLQDRELTLTPDRFAPKVIEIFESARREVLGARPPAGSAASPPPTAATEAPAKKGGSKTALILLGVGGAAAAGVAIAAGGKSGGSSSSASAITRFYGAYANVAYRGQGQGCPSFSASFSISGNPDGSAFQIVKTTSSGVFTFTGAIQSDGAFTGTASAYTISGQTTGTRITGTEIQTAAPMCTWSFDGSR